MDNVNTKTIEKQGSIVRNTSAGQDKLLQEVVEVKFQIQRKYLSVIEEICKLEGDRPIESWLREALEAEVECAIDNVDELGCIMRNNLKHRFGFQKEDDQ